MTLTLVNVIEDALQCNFICEHGVTLEHTDFKDGAHYFTAIHSDSTEHVRVTLHEGKFILDGKIGNTWQRIDALEYNELEFGGIKNA